MFFFFFFFKFQQFYIKIVTSICRPIDNFSNWHWFAEDGLVTKLAVSEKTMTTARHAAV